MSLLPSYRRIYLTDYAASYKDLISTLSVSVNNAFDSIFQAMNNGISLKDNILCTVVSVPIKVDSSGNPVQATSFKVTYTTATLGTQVIAAIGPTGVYPLSQPFISSTQNGTTVIINNITGLQANTQYTLTVVAWGT